MTQTAHHEPSIPRCFANSTMPAETAGTAGQYVSGLGDGGSRAGAIAENKQARIMRMPAK
jgi:hypothetical protein